MKKFFIAIAAVAMLIPATSLKAQDDKYGPNSAECLKYLSYYEEYMKSKNYADATPNWREAYKHCPPQSRQKMLVDGTTLLRKLISANAKNPIYKQALVDSLMTLHDQRVEFFPANAVTARNNKGLDMANYIKDDDQRLFDGLNEIIEANGTATKPNLYVINLNAAIELYKIGMIGEEEVIETYNRNVDLLSATEAKNQVDADMNEKVRADLESLFVASKVASCDKLIALFTPRFAAAPEDVELAQKIVAFMLKTEDCTDNELISKAIAVMHKNAPSASTAYLAYQIYSQRGKVDEAVKYMEEAIRLADAENKAAYNYELAMFCFRTGNSARAIEAAKTAADTDTDGKYAGKAYFLIGTIWSAVKCTGNEIASRAPFWVAVDYMQKASAADATLAAEASKKIDEFKAYFPSTADAFMFDLQDGNEYTVSCSGLRAVTRVRTQK